MLADAVTHNSDETPSGDLVRGESGRWGDVGVHAEECYVQSPAAEIAHELIASPAPHGEIHVGMAGVLRIQIRSRLS